MLYPIRTEGRGQLEKGPVPCLKRTKGGAKWHGESQLREQGGAFQNVKHKGRANQSREGQAWREYCRLDGKNGAGLIMGGVWRRHYCWRGDLAALVTLTPQGGAISSVCGFTEERPGGAGPSETYSGGAGTAISEFSKRV